MTSRSLGDFTDLGVIGGQGNIPMNKQLWLDHGGNDDPFKILFYLQFVLSIIYIIEKKSRRFFKLFVGKLYVGKLKSISRIVWQRARIRTRGSTPSLMHSHTWIPWVLIMLFLNWNVLNGFQGNIKY